MLNFRPLPARACSRMRTVLGCGLLGLALADAWGAVPAGIKAAPASFKTSEQFIVHDRRVNARYGLPTTTEHDPSLIHLEPETLLISAERIRGALHRQMQLSDLGGRISLDLYAADGNNAHPSIVSTLYREGWHYRLQVPDDLQRVRLVRGVVQVLLLELANRGTAQKSAELPTWLVEGFTASLLTEVGPGLVLDSVSANTFSQSMVVLRGADALHEARIFLRARSVLSFADLSTTPSANLPEETVRHYQYSAQVFLSELLRSKDGPARLQRMLHELPQRWNWQTAFLRAFEFPRLLDVEKWWLVALETTVGPGSMRMWADDFSLARLDEILLTPAHVRADANALPTRLATHLPGLIADWNYVQQRPVLRQKLTQLTQLRGLVSPRLAPLVDGYRACLVNYLDRRDQGGGAQNNRSQLNSASVFIVRDTLRQLTELDKQRETLRAPPIAAATSEPAQR